VLLFRSGCTTLCMKHAVVVSVQRHGTCNLVVTSKSIFLFSLTNSNAIKVIMVIR